MAFLVNPDHLDIGVGRDIGDEGERDVARIPSGMGQCDEFDQHVLPRQESFASLHILTRRASEGSEALPSLARRVSMSFFGARVIIVGHFVRFRLEKSNGRLMSSLGSIQTAQEPRCVEQHVRSRRPENWNTHEQDRRRFAHYPPNEDHRYSVRQDASGTALVSLPALLLPEGPLPMEKAETRQGPGSSEWPVAARRFAVL